MQDTTLYETILGLQAPWHVERVALDVAQQRVDLWVTHDGASWTCPECATALPGFDHSDERTWRHLDTCQFATHLHARVPRVQCPTHGVRQVAVPWAAPRSRFTLLMERLVIDVIQQCSTVTGACRLLRITWDEAWGILARAVARGQARKVARPLRYIGVDEKSFRKGQQHYHTIVCDLERGTVEYVAPGRKVESLAPFYAGLTPAHRDAIQAVAMDMWDPYRRATREGLPNGEARIVFDRFHIMKEMTTAVDQVRKQEHRTLRHAEGHSPLTGSKYLWLYSQERLPAKHAERFAELQAHHLKVGRAWAIKEALRTLWDFRRVWAAERFFQRWYHWARCSRLAPVRQAAATFKRHAAGILRYCAHPISNGVTEGVNGKIMAIKRKTCGFRNAHHFETAIYFYCGGLNLYPR